MDFIAMAETLEAQAASLRRHAAELAAEGQGALELEPAETNPWRSHAGGEQPPDTYGKNVDYRERGAQDTVHSAPAAALVWAHEGDGADILEWRFSAEQTAE